MKQSLAFLLLLASYSAAQEPAKAQPDRDAFTFTKYDLQVQVAPERQSLAVRGHVILRNDTEKPQSLVALQVSSSLTWASVRRGDAPLPIESSKIESDIDHTGAVNEAIVSLPQPVAPGGTVELGVAYSGTIPFNSARLEALDTPRDVARRSDWDRIASDFTAVRGVGYVAWYPVSLAPVRLGDGNRMFAELGVWRARHAESIFHAEFEKPENKVLLTNGQRREDGDKVVCDFARLGLEAPLFLIAEFAAQETLNGRIWYLPGGQETAKEYAAVLSKWQPAFTTAPLQKADFVQLPEGWANYESGTMMLAPLRKAPEPEIAQAMVHTLTHASVISRRPWIYEGLAHFAQARAIEGRFGRDSALQFLAQRTPALALAESTGAGQDLIKATDEIFYRTKAMFVWWMLRDMLGDATLEKALAKYRADLDKEPSYVQRLLETESGKGLEQFFDEWVYRDRGLPDFKVEAVFPRQNLRGGYLVSVTVENQGAAGAEVPVVVKTKVAEISARLFVPAKDKATTRIEVPLYPVRITVNDGSVPETDTTDNDFTVPPPK